MKIYASDSEDNSLKVFRDIAGGNIWVKVKTTHKGLITYIKIYSFSKLKLNSDPNPEGILYFRYSALPYWAKEYVSDGDTEIYEEDYNVFQLCLTTKKWDAVDTFEVVTPIEMFTDGELEEILNTCTIVYDDEDVF